MAVRDSADSRQIGLWIVGLLLSLLIHALLVVSLLVGGKHTLSQPATPEESSQGEESDQADFSQSSLAVALAGAPTSVAERSQEWTLYLTRSLQLVGQKVPQFEEGDWSREEMASKLRAAAAALLIDVKTVRLLPSDSAPGADSVVINLYSTPVRVLGDVLALGGLVGDGTLKSSFPTDKLILAIREPQGTQSINVLVPTKAARLLYLQKQSPEWFIAQLSVVPGNSSLWP